MEYKKEPLDLDILYPQLHAALLTMQGFSRDAADEFIDVLKRSHEITGIPTPPIIISSTKQYLINTHAELEGLIRKNGITVVMHNVLYGILQEINAYKNL